MQTIGPPKDNGTLETILVQADGKTGDQVDEPRNRVVEIGVIQDKP